MRPIMPRLRRFLGLHLVRVLVAPLDDLPPVKVRHPELRYAPLIEREAIEWSADPELELTEPQVREAYRRGDVCVGVSEHGRPVGYVWFAFGAVPHLADVWIAFAPAYRYTYKGFVRASHRGRRISQELYEVASELCPRRGTRAAILFIDLDNQVSLRASRRAGRVVAGYAGFVHLFGAVLAFRSPGARKCGFRFFRPQGAFARPLSAHGN